MACVYDYNDRSTSQLDVSRGLHKPTIELLMRTDIPNATVADCIGLVTTQVIVKLN